MDTQALQTTLKSLGYDPGPTDGQMGPKTIVAIQRFQEARGLRPDGVLGPMTLNRLADAGLDTPAMLPSAPGTDIIRAFEGREDGDPKTVELEPYICPAGVVTVGWGHAVVSEHGDQFRVKELGARAAMAAACLRLKEIYGRPYILGDEPEQLLAHDVAVFSSSVSQMTRNVATSQGQFDAAVSFAFNIGIGAFRKSSVLRFHSQGMPVATFDLYKVQKRSKAAEIPLDIPDAFASWSRSGGVWMLGLYRRRMAELYRYTGSEPSRAIQIARGIH